MDKAKKDMIEKVIQAVQAEGVFVRESQELSLEDQVSQMDVLLDVYHFLSDYERNVQILNKYNSDHRFDREK